MSLLLKLISCGCFTAAHTASLAANTDFTGHWVIDLRTVQQRQQKLDCGEATFTLKQTGDRITGDHTYSTAGCGRLNEGGEGTVKGIVSGSTAVLTVRSGRTGAVVLGKAARQGNRLTWTSLEEVAPGFPEHEPALILDTGVLSNQEPGAEPVAPHPVDIVNTQWRVRVLDLKKQVRVDATIRFSPTKANEACIGGDWKRVVVKTKAIHDDRFFPLSQLLAYDIADGELTLGRTKICDGYLFLSGKLSKKQIEGTFYRRSLSRSQMLGHFILSKVR